MNQATKIVTALSHQGEGIPKKRLLTSKQAATYLGRSLNGFRELYWAGRIPVVRFDRRVMFDVKDLDRFIEIHKETLSF